ncbi:MAG: hypothetical protein QM478_11970 [Flavobacteriaceae bacterium]
MNKVKILFTAILIIYCSKNFSSCYSQLTEEEKWYQENVPEEEFDWLSIESVSDEPSRIDTYLIKLTFNSQRQTGYKKSYYRWSPGPVINQMMYIDEMVGGYGQKYRTMLSEAKQPGYVDELLKGMVKNYVQRGVFDEYENQGFIYFRVVLHDEGGNRIAVSKKYRF